MTTRTLTLPHLRLWGEFLLLFVGVPLLMAANFGHFSLFGVIWALAAVSLCLLMVTPGFQPRSLFRGPVLAEWRLIGIYTLVTAITCLIVVFALVPERFLELPTHRTALWAMIMLAYPILSAWPQEIIFRTLFFERYGTLFPTASIAIIVNGAAFGFGHLFYMNPVTIAFTAAGGMIMGWAYMRHRSMALAWVLHALAGQIIFTSGLGIYFYHGAIGSTP